MLHWDDEWDEHGNWERRIDDKLDEGKPEPHNTEELDVKVSLQTKLMNASRCNASIKLPSFDFWLTFGTFVMVLF